MLGLYIFFSIVLILLVKAMYDIYWTGKKAHLKNKFLIKYGLPLVCTLLLLPHVYKIINFIYSFNG